MKVDPAISQAITDDILKTLRMDIYVNGLIYISVEPKYGDKFINCGFPAAAAPTRSIEYKSSRGAERVVRSIYLRAGRLAGRRIENMVAEKVRERVGSSFCGDAHLVCRGRSRRE